MDSGSCLSSRAVSSQVLSVYVRLTSVFGMGTGGSAQLNHRKGVVAPSNLKTAYSVIHFDQALDRLVSLSSVHYCTSTCDLSTLSSSRGLTSFLNGRSYLEVGFTLRCLQRLSVPDTATQHCTWWHNWNTGGPSD